MNEMARSLGEGPVLAPLEERRTDAYKEKSSLDVAWQFAGLPNWLQSSEYLPKWGGYPRRMIKGRGQLPVVYYYKI